MCAPSVEPMRICRSVSVRVRKAHEHRGRRSSASTLRRTCRRRFAKPASQARVRVGSRARRALLRLSPRRPSSVEGCLCVSFLQRGVLREEGVEWNALTTRAPGSREARLPRLREAAAKVRDAVSVFLDVPIESDGGEGGRDEPRLSRCVCIRQSSSGLRAGRPVRPSHPPTSGPCGAAAERALADAARACWALLWRPPRTAGAVRVVVIARRGGVGRAFLCRRRDLFGQVHAGAAVPPTVLGGRGPAVGRVSLWAGLAAADVRSARLAVWAGGGLGPGHQVAEHRVVGVRRWGSGRGRCRGGCRAGRAGRG